MTKKERSQMYRVRWLHDSGCLMQLGKGVYPLFKGREFDVRQDSDFFKRAIAMQRAEVIAPLELPLPLKEGDK